MSIFIKNVELKSNIILAPMAGFSDIAFRNMCLKYGAGLVCTEMVSSKALHYKNKKTEDLLFTLEDEIPKAVQIFGHEPEIMAEACKNPLLDKFDIIDINMGCPARKITSNGDGSALLKNIDLAREIISSCVKATEKPITVKFRIGYDENHLCAVEFAKMCEEAGASAITVHGRTTKQGYSGKSDFEIIKQVKQAVKIPVFANGDCKSREDYLEILKFTGVDGVMVGRASLGCPEVFAKMLGKTSFEVNKLEQILYHYETMLQFYSERYVVLYMRSHMACYLSGEYKNTDALLRILKLTSYKEIKEIILGLFDKVWKYRLLLFDNLYFFWL